jgi:surface polysaccharide O-acyltransferase-like enzyme
MGSLFFLSGYFTPGSFDRKGAASFATGKLLRLGVPLAVFMFLLNPVLEYAAFLMPESITGLAHAPTLHDYPGMIGLGPLWFVAMLLIFNTGYLLWRIARKKWKPSSTKSKLDAKRAIGLGAIAIFTLTLIGVSYIWRIAVPLGKSIIGFPTLAYLPQYLGFFIIGIAAYRNDWLRSFPSSRGLPGVVFSVAALLFLFPLAFSGEMFSVELTSELSRAFGNGHWRSAVYAAWDSIFSVGMTSALIIAFRSLFNKRYKLGHSLSSRNYALYFVHTPIVVYGAYLLRNLEMAPIAKFFVAVIILVPICYVTAYLLRRIPGVSKII